MKADTCRGNQSIMLRWLFVFLGVAINLLLALFNHIVELPLFLDTIGTVVVACVSGALPGILTALLTNAL